MKGDFLEKISPSPTGEVSAQINENIDEARQKAERAKRLAEHSESANTSLFGKKESIDLLRKAGVDLAESQIISSEMHKINFDSQKTLAEMIDMLFKLGVLNSANNRAVVNELKNKLTSGDSSTDGKTEIKRLIKQLDDQQDILAKLEKTEARAEKMKVALNENSTAIKENSVEVEKLKAENSALKKELKLKGRLTVTALLISALSLALGIILLFI